MCERVIVDRQRRTGKVSGSLHGRILQIALLHIFVRILVLPLIQLRHNEEIVRYELEQSHQP